MGYVFNPFTGNFDFVGDQQALASAVALKITRTAGEDILTGDALVAINNTTVGLATNDSTAQDATVLGFADHAALTGEQITITLMGVISDTSFSVFTVNSLLFLDVAGAITDVRPTTGYLTTIGHSLGSNDIFVSIQKPVKL